MKRLASLCRRSPRPPGSATLAPAGILLLFGALACSASPPATNDESVAAPAADIASEIDTLLVSAAIAEERLALVGSPALLEEYRRVVAAAEVAALASERQQRAGDSPQQLLESLAELDRAAARIPALVKRIKLGLSGQGAARSGPGSVFAGLDALKVAAQSLSAQTAARAGASGAAPLGHLPLAEQASIEAFNGPLLPGSSWYVLDEGHIDAIDVAFEDDELGITVHDETVDPDVERDPSKTLLIVKPSARVQVPDERFAFLGPPGSDVWLLPEGQPEAEAAGLLWAGIATAEIEAGVFVSDSVDVVFQQVVGADGVSLFESPADELSSPVVLVDSENGLPDALSQPVGVHRHANWAFEAPGLYLLRVQARGRLAELPGQPWVSSASAWLKFVVVP